MEEGMRLVLCGLQMPPERGHGHTLCSETDGSAWKLLFAFSSIKVKIHPSFYTSQALSQIMVSPIHTTASELCPLSHCCVTNTPKT